MIDCLACDGTGREYTRADCDVCDGTGAVNSTRECLVRMAERILARHRADDESLERAADLLLRASGAFGDRLYRPTRGLSSPERMVAREGV